MSMKPLIVFNNVIFTNVNMATAGTQASTAINLDGIEECAIQISWVGTAPVGTLSYQGSNDNVVYTEFASGGVSGNTGSGLVNIESPAYSWVQVTYTKTSGTGTLNGNINGKQR